MVSMTMWSKSLREDKKNEFEYRNLEYNWRKIAIVFGASGEIMRLIKHAVS